MGKNSKRQEAEQAREFRLRREQEELQKKKQQNKLIMWIVLGIVAVAVVAALIALITTLTDSKKSPTSTGPINSNVNGMKDTTFTETDQTTDYVKLTVTYTDKDGNAQEGDIVIQLCKDAAPLTVANFQKLVSQNFYNGLTFHRVVSGFMIQGGDPQGTGSGGSSTTIKGEFSTNGVENPLKHTRGVISMARSQSPNSASSQFFIVHEDSTFLDGEYAAFGWVVSGMDTVDGIAGTPVEYGSSGVDNQPSHPVNPVTIVKAVFVRAN